MDTVTARLILGVDSATSADHLRARFAEQQERLEGRIVSASAAPEKDEHRQALARLQEAYAVLSGAAPAPVAAPAAIASAPAEASATRRSRPVAAVATGALILGLAGGGWWWLRAQQSIGTRDRLLAEISAVTLATDAPTTAALESRITSFAASGRADDQAQVAAAWAARVASVRLAREAHERQAGELAHRLDALAGVLARADAEIAAAQLRHGQMTVAESLAGAQRTYAETRRTLWGDYLGWLRQAIASEPAQARLATARAALASDHLAEAETAAAAGEAAMQGWGERTAGEREKRFTMPLLRLCADSYAGGAAGIAGWYKADEPVDVALQLLAKRLAALDRVEPPAGDAAADLAFYTALGGDGHQVAAWRDRLRHIAELTTRLAPLDDAQAAPGAWLALEKPLAELVALVGDRAAPTAGWTTDLRDRRARLDGARAALVVLDRGQTGLDADLATVLDAQLDILATLVAADDPDLARWRAALDPLAAASRYQRAMAAKDLTEHKRLLVASARGGNLDAGARMVLLAMWGEMGTLDPRAPRLAAWASDGSVHGPFTARQICGEFVANWATRHKRDGIDWNAEMRRGRELITSGPLDHPVLANEAGWLYEDVTPGDDADQSHALRLRSATLAEAAAATADPFAADAILTTGASGAHEVGDAVLAQHLYERAAEVAIAGGRPVIGAERLIGAASMCAEDAAKAPLIARAATLYRDEARAAQERGDLAQHARCLRGLAACLRPDSDPVNGSWERAAAAYAEAATAFAAAKQPRDEAGAIDLQGDCWSPDYNPGGSWERAAECYHRAGERAKAAGAPLLAAQYLAECALCHSPAKNAAGSWTDTADLYAAAADLAGEAGSRSSRAVYLRDQARALLDGSDHGAPGHLGQAAELYGTAAALMAATGDLSGQSHCLHQQAWCLDPDNNPAGSAERSVALYRQAVTAGIAAGRDKSELAVSYFNLGLNLMPKDGSAFAGSWVQAKEALAEAARNYLAGGNEDSAGRALYEQALCLYPGRDPAGGYAQALELANAAVDKLKDVKSRAYLAGTQALRGDCLRPTNNPGGSWSDAVAAYAEAVRLYSDLGEQATVADQISNQAWCLMPCRNPGGSWSDAEALYVRAVQLASRPADTALNAHCLHQQAVCAIRNDSANMTDGARALFQRAADLYRSLGREADAKISDGWLGK